MRDLIAFSSLAYPDLGLREVLEKTLWLGLRSIELRISRDGIHISPETDPEILRNLLREINVRVVLLSSYVRTHNPETIEGREALNALEKIVNIAYRCGIDRVRVLALYEESIERSIQNTREFLRRVEKRLLDVGIRLLFETHDYFAETSNALRLADLLSNEFSEVTGILLDPANMLMKMQSYREIIERYRDHVYHIHVKNFVFRDREVFYTQPNTGVVPICDIVSSFLDKIFSKRIIFSIEWERLWRRDLENPDHIIPLYISYLEKCLEGSR